MKVSVFGLGYVGVVTVACLARDGHTAIGVDVVADKVERVARGESPIVEAGLADLLAAGVAAGRISATTDAVAAVAQSEISMISVGTPPDDDGVPDLSYVERVCSQIGAAIAAKRRSHVVVMRSTVPPGTTERCLELISAAAGDRGLVHVAFNPEFLREGSAIRDYDHPAYTITGTEDPVAEQAVRDLFAAVDAPLHVVPPSVAEMVKYVANSWHAAKITFANEIGRVAKAFGVDGRVVMDLIARDAKLNVSPVYMRPGFAYGGSCLPKDVRALQQHARVLGVEVPVIDAIPRSNERQVNEAIQLIERTRRRRVGVLGLSFKAGTDDLRESPILRVIGALVGKGYSVLLHDPNLDMDKVLGANRRFVEDEVPYLPERLRQDLNQVVRASEVVVVANGAREYRGVGALLEPGQVLVDLVHAVDPASLTHGEYHGLVW